MSQSGIGVIFGYLGGNAESVQAFRKGVNKQIRRAHLEDNALYFEFMDGYKMRLVDNGQSCCENRYMQTDDDLSKFSGAILRDVEIREAPSVADEYGEEHEVQFLVVKTSLGEFVMANHNEHNGYYGGFWVVVQEVTE